MSSANGVGSSLTSISTIPRYFCANGRMRSRPPSFFDFNLGSRCGYQIRSVPCSLGDSHCFRIPTPYHMYALRLTNCMAYRAVWGTSLQYCTLCVCFIARFIQLNREAPVTDLEWEVLRYCDVFKAGGPVEQAVRTRVRPWVLNVTMARVDHCLALFPRQAIYDRSRIDDALPCPHSRKCSPPSKRKRDWPRKKPPPGNAK